MNKVFFAFCILLVCFSTDCFSGEKYNMNSYFDVATGHRYEKVDNISYAEFTQKGQFFKKVPSNLPLLQNNSKVHPIPDNSYILYEKVSNGVSEQKILPENIDHPLGWKAKKVLISLN